jgi:hypothetical protein
MTTQALRRALRTPLAVYRAEPAAFTFALLPRIDVISKVNRMRGVL